MRPDPLAMYLHMPTEMGPHWLVWVALAAVLLVALVHRLGSR